MHDPGAPRRTGEVADSIARELGIQLTEAQLNALLRRRPNLRPPLLAGRRAWRCADVERVLSFLAASRVAQPAGNLNGPVEVA